MKVRSIELVRAELELMHPVVSSKGTYGRRPVSILIVETDDARGVGECSALLEPTYTEEFADDAERVLAKTLIPLLLSAGGVFTSPDKAMEHLSSVAGQHMAKAAIEMALIDAALRGEGTSLASKIGAVKTVVAAGATFGIQPIEETCAHIADVMADGYRRIKLKIAPHHDVSIVEQVRTRYPELLLAVDANGAYRFADDDDRNALLALDGLGLCLLEQPFAKDAFDDHAALRDLIASPVILDESITDIASLEVGIAKGAMDGVSIKPARLGGIRTAMAARDRCVSEGLHLCIGGLYESGIGRAASLAVGATAGFDLPGDLGGSDRYFARDLTAPHVVHDGMIAVPSAPGIGVDLDEDLLDELATRRYSFVP